MRCWLWRLWCGSVKPRLRFYTEHKQLPVDSILLYVRGHKHLMSLSFKMNMSHLCSDFWLQCKWILFNFYLNHLSFRTLNLLQLHLVPVTDYRNSRLILMWPILTMSQSQQFLWYEFSTIIIEGWLSVNQTCWNEEIDNHILSTLQSSTFHLWKDWLCSSNCKDSWQTMSPKDKVNLGLSFFHYFSNALITHYKAL